jgi:tungstate transport system substrate-binding protein
VRRLAVDLRAVAPVIAAISVLAGACRHSAGHQLALGTTTSVGNSGLLEVLLPAFDTDRGIDIRPSLIGSGRALKMLADGVCDVVISHAPDAETAALSAHPGWQYTKIMYNDFVLVGPPGDPAHVRGSPSVEDAMRRIAAADVRFISRGDGSGTQEREQLLWKVAGAKPAEGRLVIAGAGMGATLRIASETVAYTLTDRATFGQLSSRLALAIVFEGGERLLNTYAVVVDPSATRARDARAFADWLSSGKGRDLITAYRVGRGIVAFQVWPANRPRSSPRDLPF